MPSPNVNLVADLRAAQNFLKNADNAEIGDRMSRAILYRWQQMKAALNPDTITMLRNELKQGPWSSAIKLELEEFLANEFIDVVNGESLSPATCFPCLMIFCNSYVASRETSVRQQYPQEFRDQCLVAVLSRLARPVSRSSSFKTCETSVSLK